MTDLTGFPPPASADAGGATLLPPLGAPASAAPPLAAGPATPPAGGIAPAPTLQPVSALPRLAKVGTRVEAPITGTAFAPDPSVFADAGAMPTLPGGRTSPSASVASEPANEIPATAPAEPAAPAPSAPLPPPVVAEPIPVVAESAPPAAAPAPMAVETPPQPAPAVLPALEPLTAPLARVESAVTSLAAPQAEPAFAAHTPAHAAEPAHGTRSIVPPLPALVFASEPTVAPAALIPDVVADDASPAGPVMLDLPESMFTMPDTTPEPITTTVQGLFTRTAITMSAPDTPEAKEAARAARAALEAKRERSRRRRGLTLKGKLTIVAAVLLLAGAGYLAVTKGMESGTTTSTKDAAPGASVTPGPDGSVPTAATTAPVMTAPAVVPVGITVTPNDDGTFHVVDGRVSFDMPAEPTQSSTDAALPGTAFTVTSPEGTLNASVYDVGVLSQPEAAATYCQAALETAAGSAGGTVDDNTVVSKEEPFSQVATFTSAAGRSHFQCTSMAHVAVVLVGTSAQPQMAGYDLMSSTLSIIP